MLMLNKLFFLLSGAIPLMLDAFTMAIAATMHGNCSLNDTIRNLKNFKNAVCLNLINLSSNWLLFVHLFLSFQHCWLVLSSVFNESKSKRLHHRLSFILLILFGESLDYHYKHGICYFLLILGFIQ